ncbi:MAG: phosphate acyltransferase PlsX, partial [Puniceicoccales bacterium]|nr:phosphate acyltransferase PlsX [Puniceicoccales bacterium]
MNECPDDTTIAVDVMGADKGIDAFIRGVIYAFKNFPGELGKVVLVGNEEKIKRAITGNKAGKFFENVNIVHTSQEIDMEDKPMSALRSKKDASMFRAIELVKEGKADGMLSSGNTGCLMAGGTL